MVFSGATCLQPSAVLLLGLHQSYPLGHVDQGLHQSLHDDYRPLHVRSDAMRLCPWEGGGWSSTFRARIHPWAELSSSLI